MITGLQLSEKLLYIPHFFPLLILFKICCFLLWIESVNPHFLLPYIIMDLPIFVIAERATQLVDICCPRGGS